MVVPVQFSLTVLPVVLVVVVARTIAHRHKQEELAPQVRVMTAVTATEAVVQVALVVAVVVPVLPVWIAYLELVPPEMVALDYLRQLQVLQLVAPVVVVVRLVEPLEPRLTAVALEAKLVLVLTVRQTLVGVVVVVGTLQEEMALPVSSFSACQPEQVFHFLVVSRNLPQA